MKKISVIIFVVLLLGSVFLPVVSVSAFSTEVYNFDRIWHDSEIGFNKNEVGMLVLAVTYTNATAENPNFREIDYCSVSFMSDPFYFSITFSEELEITRDSEGNIIYQEPKDGFVFLRRSFVDNHLGRIKEMASKNINYKTVTFNGTEWYRIKVPNFNKQYEWKQFVEPTLAEKWFTWGSSQSIKFKTRAMHIRQTQDDVGHLDFDFTHDSDNSGQQVSINKEYLSSKGINNPIFEWEHMWLPYSENTTHYTIFPKHFSQIGIHETSEGTCIGGIQMSLTDTVEDIYAVAFSPDGKYLAVGVKYNLFNYDHSLYIYDTSNWSLEETIDTSPYSVYSVAFSHDNKWLALGVGFTAGSGCRIYNRTDWSLEVWFTNVSCYSPYVAFSQNSEYVAHSIADSRVFVRTTSDWEHVATLGEADPAHPTYAVSFSPDNNNIAYGGFDDEVYIHNVSNWGLNTTLTSASDVISSISFSQDNNNIAYGSYDDKVYIHNVSDWSLNVTLDESTNDVKSVAFSPNNKYIVYGGADNKVYVHNASDWSLVTTLTESTEAVVSVDFSCDSNIIAYGGYDIKTYIFNIFNVTRTLGGDSAEQNTFSFSPPCNYSGNVTIKCPVSTGVKGIVNVRNNTCGTEATQVNTSDEITNNTFWYDVTNQFVYIGTIDLTTSTDINWTVNCSYGVNFNLIIPPYLEVGQYFHSQGFISDSDGNTISGMIAETRLLYPNGTDALSVNPKWNCTGGNYRCTFSTAVLPPGIYSVSIEFTDPTSGIVFKKGSTLYLSFATPDGVYSNAMVYFSFYNTNIGLGLIPETFKVYVNDVRNYLNVHYGYTGETINITIRDYYDFVMYSSDYTITQTYTGLNFGLTFHEYDFTNANDEYFYASFLKDGATRWYERVVSSSGGQKSFMLPSGNYTVRVYNADNSTYLSWDETINRSKAYLIGIDGVSLIIQGQSVIVGKFLELNEDIDYALMPDAIIYSRNPPIIFSAFDRIGMMLGQNMYRICPSINVIAQTRYEETGNWINSTPLIPSNGTTENGSITVTEDIICFNIVNGTVPTWINITYTSNKTVIQNTTHIPSRFYPEGFDITINASADIHITRETRFNQLKKFYWDVYPGTDNPGWITESSGQKRAGYYRAGLEVTNTMDTIWYDVYVYAGFSPDSEADLSTVRVRDVDNDNRILDEGENYKAGGGGIEFRLTGCLNISETRNFLAEYYKSFLEQYYYGSDIININAYEIGKRHHEKLYNYFEYTWINSYPKTYRGALSFYFDFEVETGIKQDDVVVYDAGMQQNITEFIISDQFLQIGGNAVGDISPGGGKTYEVYFKFETYPGQKPEDLHIATPLATWGEIPFSFFLIFVFIGLFLMILGILLFVMKEKKRYKDYGKGLVGLGLLIAVIVWILSALGV